MLINHNVSDVKNLDLRIKEVEQPQNVKLALKISKYVNIINKIKQYNLIINEYSLKIDELTKSLN